MIVSHVNLVKRKIKSGFPVSTRLITSFINEEFGVDCTNPSSRKKYVITRQLAMYFARKYTRETLHQISFPFKKYHSSVSYSCNVVENLIETDKLYRLKFKDLETKIKKL
jgi:chromosomal replication initiation ATPase DnaA